MFAPTVEEVAPEAPGEGLGNVPEMTEEEEASQSMIEQAPAPVPAPTAAPVPELTPVTSKSEYDFPIVIADSKDSKQDLKKKIS